MITLSTSSKIRFNNGILYVKSEVYKVIIIGNLSKGTYSVIKSDVDSKIIPHNRSLSMQPVMFVQYLYYQPNNAESECHKLRDFNSIDSRNPLIDLLASVPCHQQILYLGLRAFIRHKTAGREIPV